MGGLGKLLSRLAIPHLALWVALCQFVTYMLAQVPKGESRVFDALDLVPERVLHHHEWYRLVTFVALPPLTNPVFLILGLYFFWLMGNALEAQWGTVRFNLYFLLGWAALVVLSMGAAIGGEAGWLPDDLRQLGEAPVGNEMLCTSVFLAFAWLYPRFVIYLYFVIPIQVRWLAAITWVMYLYVFSVGSLATRLAVAAAVINFVIYFGPAVYRRMRHGHSDMAGRVRELHQTFHRCASCGATERTDPDLKFRICTDCRPGRELCSICLKNGHAHVVTG
jgi:hypothetical protein